MQTGFDLVASLVSPLISPNFTGTPTAPTATVGTNTTQLATTAFVLAQSFSATGAEFLTNKDASSGYAGLTLYKVNFKNAANTFTSFLTNANTAARTYTYPDKDGTVAMTVDITGGTSAAGFTTLSTTGAATVGAGLAVTGTLTVVTPAILGYGTGAGGTVTQATSKSTTVTLNKPTGQITMTADALAAGGTNVFQVLNSLVGAADTVVLTMNNQTLQYSVRPGNLTAGTFYIALKNETVGSLSDAVSINFAIIKGSAT